MRLFVYRQTQYIRNSTKTHRMTTNANLALPRIHSRLAQENGSFYGGLAELFRQSAKQILTNETFGGNEIGALP